MEDTVRSGLVMAWRFATWPTMRSPVLEKATTEGVVRAPSALGITTGSPPSITATQEFVVPKSMPIVFAIINYLPLMKNIVSVLTLCQQLLFWSTLLIGHLNHGVANHPVPQLVAL